MDYQHIFFIFTCSLVSAGDVKYVLKGQEITLGPSSYRQPTEIYWTHHVYNIVSFDGTMETVAPAYENKILLDRNSAVLTIKQATYEDSGNYDQEVTVNKKVYHNAYKIEVIDKISKPNISCVMIDTYQAMLMCSTESKLSPLLKFKWRSGGNEQTGPILTITLRKFLNHQVYICEVSNPLTVEMATFTAKDCLSGKLTVAEIVVIMTSMVVFIGLCIFLGFYIKRQAYQEYLQSKKRRMELYNMKNSNRLWFLESYEEELKPYGITISACTDIFSGTILWIEAHNNDGDPAVFLNHFLDTVTRIGGCPQRLLFKPSRENRHIITAQTFLRRNHTDCYAGEDSVMEEFSVRRRRWLHTGMPWKSCFADLRELGHFTGKDSDKKLIQFCFLHIIQDQLKEFVGEFNRNILTSQRDGPAEDKLQTVLPEDIDECRRWWCTPRGRYPCDETLFKRWELIRTENGWEAPVDECTARKLYLDLRKKTYEDDEVVMETCNDEEEQAAGLLE
ncbi:uncharacterized protein [Nerophis lumbriciformis]|uniref:uncharacterized protein isoform X2 n=2 Tax=Nerophis lumbriciformis TaxID=546530 RepID=UPI003BAA30B7